MRKTTEAARWTEYMELGELTPNPANPKNHDSELIDASVGRFGYVDPVVMDERTGYLISGHGRRKTLLAMHERGESAPEGVQVSGSDTGGTWLVPVSRGWASRTDTEAAAALVAMNRTTEAGGWDDSALLDLLDQVAEVGEEAFTGVGFGEDDLDDLRAKLEELGEETADAGDGDSFGGGAEENTREDKTLQDYADDYAEQGRRLIVLDYSVSEYPQVTSALRALRESRRVDNNAEAVAGLLSDMFPNALPADVEEDGMRSLGLDNSDPAATMEETPRDAS